jgi:hypothetical protein
MKRMMSVAPRGAEGSVGHVECGSDRGWYLRDARYRVADQLPVSTVKVRLGMFTAKVIDTP